MADTCPPARGTICPVAIPDRRRTFWTTQACSTDALCGDTCETSYGLQMYCPDGDACSANHVPEQRRSFVTSDWVRSLALNILLTAGRRENKGCGYRPGARGGHWSDSYRSSSYPGTAGSNIGLLDAQGSIAEAIAQLRAIVKHDMTKLVTYGVATGVDVSAEYSGNNTAKLDIKIYGVAGETVKVGASLSRVKNDWAWLT